MLLCDVHRISQGSSLDSFLVILPHMMALIVVGMLAGFMAGLFGIGGGVVTVPALYSYYEIMGYAPEWRMHIAIATSLSIIIGTSISSVSAHHKRNGVDWNIIKNWWFAIAVGALIGSYFAKQLKTEDLIIIITVLIALLALKMLLPLDNWRLGKKMPVGPTRYGPPLGIGFLSAIMGIGGGSFAVPYMTLYGVPIHRAVGTAAFTGFVISLCGGFGFLLGGLSVQGLPSASLGFVHLPTLLTVGAGSVLMAPVGSRTAHKLSRRTLSVIFGVFLIIAAARMYMAL